jgi:Fis family transcriptional regulator
MTQPIPPFSFESEMLSKLVEKETQKYLASIKDPEPMNLYRHIIELVEPPLLKCVMKHAKGNQKRAATCLGFNNSTLKEKIKHYKL